MTKDPIVEFEGNKYDAGETLDALKLRTGEIIEHFLGAETLRERFEEDPEFQNRDYGDAPTGIIALKESIVDAEMKDALLIGQAAAYVNDAAETINQAAEFANQPDITADELRQNYGGQHLHMQNEVFNFVGSDNDSAQLAYAQRTRMIANEALCASLSKLQVSRNEDEVSLSPQRALQSFPDPENVSPALQQAAAGLLDSSAQTLEKKGYADIAAQFKNAAKHVRPENASEISFTPGELASKAAAVHSADDENLAALHMSHYKPDDAYKEGDIIRGLAKKLTQQERQQAPKIEEPAAK